MTDQDYKDFVKLSSQLDKVLLSFVKDARTIEIATRTIATSFMSITMLTEEGDINAVVKVCCDRLVSFAKNATEAAKGKPTRRTRTK